MPGFSVWVQDVDYKMIVDKAVKTAPPVLRLLDGHDWDAHLGRYADRVLSGEDTCPPVLGLTEDEYGDWMRILPQMDETFDLSWERGLPSERPEGRMFSGVKKGADRALLADAVQRFMAGDIDWLNEHVS